MEWKIGSGSKGNTNLCHGRLGGCELVQGGSEMNARRGGSKREERWKGTRIVL